MWDTVVHVSRDREEAGVRAEGSGHLGGGDPDLPHAVRGAALPRAEREGALLEDHQGLLLLPEREQERQGQTNADQHQR